MDSEATVRALFALSGVQPPEDEMQGFIERYPKLRAVMDSLYAVPGAERDEGILAFRPDESEFIGE